MAVTANRDGGNQGNETPVNREQSATAPGVTEIKPGLVCPDALRAVVGVPAEKPGGGGPRRAMAAMPQDCCHMVDVETEERSTTGCFRLHSHSRSACAAVVCGK
mmetsp:Transcript_8306/g.23821  ORF Transcript_8306/g.23821 Transcript_8306/m.23821 type:complete len:104 (+) Transcript_8306:62-373(+)